MRETSERYGDRVCPYAELEGNEMPVTAWTSERDTCPKGHRQAGRVLLGKGDVIISSMGQGVMMSKFL